MPRLAAQRAALDRGDRPILDVVHARVVAEQLRGALALARTVALLIKLPLRLVLLSPLAVPTGRRGALGHVASRLRADALRAGRGREVLGAAQQAHPRLEQVGGGATAREAEREGAERVFSPRGLAEGVGRVRLERAVHLPRVVEVAEAAYRLAEHALVLAVEERPVNLGGHPRRQLDQTRRSLVRVGAQPRRGQRQPARRVTAGRIAPCRAAIRGPALEAP